MRNGIDLNASHSPIRPEARAQLVFSLALIALCAGCNALVDFGDFEFGNGGKGDSGTADSGPAADGGEGDSGPIGPGNDASVTPRDGGGDASVSGDAATEMDAGLQDAGGDVDSGNGGTDSGIVTCHVEICDNGKDDDCDRRADCDDTDCAGVGSCCGASPENTQAACTDGRDNDCSGQRDCTDLNCSGTLACCTPTGLGERTAGACSDGIDDDCDGKVDCADTDCAGLAACCAVMMTSGGGGTTSTCCTPDGLNESDQPNDGKDNDCDGRTDIPVLQSAFPTQGLPASADEVRLTFMTEIKPSATLSCSTKRPGQPAAFSPCPMSGMAVKPFTGTDSADPANDGLWITQVRWDFPIEGTHSAIYTFSYYLHSTLNGVAHCTPFHTDKQWFGKAISRLNETDAGAFKLGTDTFLASPFIRVTYEIPWSSNPVWKIGVPAPSIDMWSLRRRFTLSNSVNTSASAAGKFLLITRNYKGSRTGTCSAAAIRVHLSHWSTANRNFKRYTCDAVVMNRHGVGVCLNNGAMSTDDPVFSPAGDSLTVVAPAGWQYANKFMWRNLIEKKHGEFTNFTNKCSTLGCPDLYLPNRMQFAP